MKQVVITVASDGAVTIEAVGFKGNACEKATEALEKALGVPGNRKKKPEYYSQNTGQQSIGGAR